MVYERARALPIKPEHKEPRTRQERARYRLPGSFLCGSLVLWFVAVVWIGAPDIDERKVNHSEAAFSFIFSVGLYCLPRALFVFY